MLPARRKAIFILQASHHGTLIVNRMDWRPEPDDPNKATGVGVELLETGAYQPGEVDCAVGILALRRSYYGDGVLAIDGGANIGVHTVEWAKFMPDWGRVIALEPQERVYYALAGNIALNNCFNACALQAAVSDKIGHAPMPVPDYSVNSNFGAVSMVNKSDIGQDIKDWATTATITIDGMKLDRCDLIKLDIEGMELTALAGAKDTIETHRPVLVIEHIMIDNDKLADLLGEWGYEFFYFGQNIIAAHRLDKCLDHIRELHHHLTRARAQEAFEAA